MTWPIDPSSEAPAARGRRGGDYHHRDRQRRGRLRPRADRLLIPVPSEHRQRSRCCRVGHDPRPLEGRDQAPRRSGPGRARPGAPPTAPRRSCSTVRAANGDGDDGVGRPAERSIGSTDVMTARIATTTVIATLPDTSGSGGDGIDTATSITARPGWKVDPISGAVQLVPRTVTRTVSRRSDAATSASSSRGSRLDDGDRLVQAWQEGAISGTVRIRPT